MNDTFATILAIGISAVILFIFPLMAIADRNDDIATQTYQQKTVEFVDKERNQGSITQDDLEAYKTSIAAVGYPYKIESEVKRIDENMGKKTEWTTSTVIGENVYYSIYTDTIENEVYGSSGRFPLKEGDILSVSAVNTKKTLAQNIRGSLFAITGQGDAGRIRRAAAGVATNNGSNI